LEKVKLPLNSLYKMPKSRKIRRVRVYFFDDVQSILLISLILEKCS